ncbi:MAG: response regulator [Chloroflexi bacterium]|nr:response regulator [Chloroflexota bacterium]
MVPCVLYVEDKIDNLMLVRRILEAEGLEVLEATSAREGIEMAERHLPDLILMDINMPEMDGLAATSYLRQVPELSKTPIVAVTANVMRNILEETLAAGCDGYITKPIDIDIFPQQVLDYLNGKGE